jgi:predicted nucleotidyltransferase
MTNDQLWHILRELRQAFATLYGDKLAQMILYGSQARGDATPESDIDVLVVLHGEVNPYKEIIFTEDVTAALSLKYDTFIACVYVSAKRWNEPDSPFLMNVIREGVAFFDTETAIPVEPR